MKNMKIPIYFMILLNNIPRLYINALSICLFFILFIGKNSAQDLRDFEHTREFANYLFQSRQFALASEEYERLVYFDSTNANSRLRLIQSYRYSGKQNIALERFERFFKDSLLFIKKDFAEEYVKNLILQKENDKVIDFLKCNANIDDNSRQNYTLAGYLLQKNWDQAFNFALKNPVTKDKKNADLHVIAFQCKQIKYKKPFVAALFSSVIPGTGKFYSKNWKDGLISMALVGVNAWQSYRGFNKYGSNSVYGWIFAGFAGSFYLGNIYGSCKSVKKYNHKLDDEIYNHTWHLVVDDL
jgi:hypothetical protein